MRNNAPVLIRPRHDDDLPACAGLVREVHAANRYPRYLPADLAAFLTPPDPYGCWVTQQGGEVLGHIALVPRGLPATLEVAADALGLPPGRLAVVARLFVSPRARGQGAGRLLLDAATEAARARGLHPVLDVDTDLAAAIALYESRGWTRAGQVTATWPNGRTLTEYVYLGPRTAQG